MNSATLLNSRHSALIHTPPPSVGTALRELATATRHLVVALWTATTQRTVVETRVLTATEEADQLRAMADDLLPSDRRFALELYAMADRHELTALNA